MNKLERRYRRLLACYPRDHRERDGEEMLGVLMADAGDRTRPTWRETTDLLWAAARLHLRRVVAADGGITPGDVLAIVSLVGPLALLGGATTNLHEIAWWVKAGALWDMPLFEQAPQTPVWFVWLAVAVFSLLRLRRTAAVAAWLGMAGFVVVATERWWTGMDAGWVLLGALVTVALTWSPGPARGRELAGRSAIPVMIATVIAAGALGVFGYGTESAEWPRLAVLAIGTVAACAPWSRIGRRAGLVLLVPVMTALLAKAMQVSLPTAATATIFYGVPVVVLLATGGLPRRISRRVANGSAGGDGSGLSRGL